MDEDNSAKNSIIGTPFPKGKSGNPNGRPRGAVCLTTIAKRRLKELNPKTGKQFAETIVDGWILQAAKGNGTALKELLNRVDGVVKDELEHKGEVTFRLVRGKPNE